MSIGRKLWWRGLACAILFAGNQGVLAQNVPEATPLEIDRPADPANGRKIVADRRRGLCLLCHSGPFPEERFQGTLAPSLAGAGSRWTTGQLRMRIIDSSTINRQSIMPAYFRKEGQNRVARSHIGRTILTAEEIEDVTAFLATLRD
ncbi:Sulfur oxidation c-type cytochrome SoxX [Rhabdaerophilaceae bacterium]